MESVITKHGRIVILLMNCFVTKVATILLTPGVPYNSRVNITSSETREATIKGLLERAAREVFPLVWFNLTLENGEIEPKAYSAIHNWFTTSPQVIMKSQVTSTDIEFKCIVCGKHMI